MNQFEHLLSKHGILSTFNLAKKIKKEDVKKIKNELKKVCKTKEELNEKLQRMIILQIKNTINKSDIPGLIGKKDKDKDNNKVLDINSYFNIFNINEQDKKKLFDCFVKFKNIIDKEKLNTDLILILIQLLLVQNKISSDDIKIFNEKYKLIFNEQENYIDNVDDEKFSDDDDDDDFNDEDDDDDLNQNI